MWTPGSSQASHMCNMIPPNSQILEKIMPAHEQRACFWPIFTTATRSATVVSMSRSVSVCIVNLNLYIVDEVIEVDEIDKADISAAAVVKMSPIFEKYCNVLGREIRKILKTCFRHKIFVSLLWEYFGKADGSKRPKTKSTSTLYLYLYLVHEQPDNDFST